LTKYVGSIDTHVTEAEKVGRAMMRKVGVSRKSKTHRQ